MDPQQRLLLHVASEALQDAGYVPNATPSFESAAVGVFIGAATHDYVHNLQNDVDSYYSTGQWIE
jgi:acyl transferase domain-containing protein